MKRRTARLLIAGLAVVCLGMLASVAYPVSTATPQASLPADQPGDEGFSVGDHEAFSVDARLVTDGETQVTLDGAVTADGPRYMRFNGSGSISETYQATPNATVYDRVTVYRDSRVDRWRTSLETNADRELLRETRTDEGTVFITRMNDSRDVVDELSGSASLFVRELQFTSYDRVGDAGTTQVYEPQNGWFDESQAYRITNASGTVRVDSETRTIESATVRWARTIPADTYAHYLVARLFGEQPTRSTVSYEYETDEPTVSAPAWLPANATG